MKNFSRSFALPEVVGGPEDKDSSDVGGVDLPVGVGSAGAAIAVASVRADDGAGAARRHGTGLRVCRHRNRR